MLISFSPLRKVRNCIVNTFLALLPRLLPKRGRRAIFLTTLFVEIARLSAVHRDLLKELNTKLHIVNDVDALMLPAHLHDALWVKRNIRIRTDREIQKEDIDGLCLRIADEFQAWSRYGDREEVLNEIRHVIEMGLEGRQKQLISQAHFTSKLELWEKERQTKIHKEHHIHDHRGHGHAV